MKAIDDTTHDDSDASNTVTFTYTANIHTHDAVTPEAVESACTEDGMTQGSCCASCGDILVAQEVIPATGHAAVA